MLNDIKTFFGLLDNRYKLLLFILFLSMLLGSILETFGIALLIPLLQNIFDNQFSFNFILFKITNIENYDINSLFILFFSIIILKNVILLIILFFQQFFAWDLGKYISNQLFNSYLKKNIQYLSKSNSSYIIRNVITETNSVIGIAISSTVFLRESLVLFFILSFLIILNANIIIFFFLPIILILIIIYFPNKALIKKHSLSRQILEGERLKVINDFIGSFIETKLLNLRNYFYNKFSKINKNYAKSGQFTKFFALSTSYFFEFLLAAFAMIFLFAFENNFFFEKDTIYISLSYASIYGLSLFRIIPSLNRIFLSFNEINVNSPSLQVVQNELNNELYHSDRNNNKKIKISKSLIFKNLNFSYGNKSIFKNADIYFNKGDIIGVIGESGSGKTTLIKIISGLYTNIDANIYVDDVEVNGNDFLRNKCFLVQQISNIMDESIYENVTFSDSSYKNDILFKKSLKFSNVSDLYNEIYDTKLGSGGSKLSGGEKQRIALSRMFYHMRDVLIFDESTNSLDSQNESIILEKLIELKKNKIIIFISHQTKTVNKICNSIYKIKKNNLVKIK